MFSKVFIEEAILHHPRTQNILKSFPHIPHTTIKKVDDIWGRVKKPYLQKRDSLQLFIGEKRGSLVKDAPQAYGLSGDPHYYFIHAYNCIYECEYCYLQGYFHTPDLVLFINHEDIGIEIKRLAQEVHPQETVWFHAGEFSDSLALSHLTGELPYYFELFRTLPHAKLELRTKSVNVRELLQLSPLPNVIVTFSLSPDEQIRKHDLKTPPLKSRLKAIKTLADHGFKLGLHFDPIIDFPQREERYSDLVNETLALIPSPQLEYISLGVVRFPQDIYREVAKNYPQSDLLKTSFSKSFDNKIRYSRPHRQYILRQTREFCLQAGAAPEKVYLCMENP